MNPNSSLFNQLLQLRCPIHSKSGELLVHVCLNPVCKQQPLLCLLCKEKSHPTHLTSSITKFASDIENTNYDMYATQKLNLYTSQLKQQKIKFLNTLAEAKAQIIQVMDTSIQMFSGIMDEANTQIRNTYHSLYGSKLQFDINPNTPINHIFEEVKLQRDQLYSWANKKQPYEMNLNNVIIQTNEQIKSLVSNLQPVIKTKLAQIRQCSHFKIKTNNSGSLVIFLKTLTGQNVYIQGLSSSTTIQQLKSIAQPLTNVPKIQQRIIFAGKQLEDGRTLGDYKIERESTLHQVRRLVGD